MKLALPVLLSLSCAHFAMGELVWEKPLQEFVRSPKEQQLTVDFRFKNTGAAPVTINDIKSSCGCCTTVALEKKTYRPDESGAISAKFVFGGRRGMQVKTISVSTSDGKRAQLSFQCNIVDDLVTFSSSAVDWRAGGASTPRSVQVNLPQNPAIRITAVASSSPRFSAELVQTTSGAGHVVEIRPADTTAPHSAEIFVQTNYPPDGPKAYTIRARVK